MIRRPPRSTLSSSSAASDVYKRQPIAMTAEVGPDGARPRAVSELKFSLEADAPHMWARWLALQTSLQKLEPDGPLMEQASELVNAAGDAMFRVLDESDEQSHRLNEQMTDLSDAHTLLLERIMEMEEDAAEHKQRYQAALAETTGEIAQLKEAFNTHEAELLAGWGNAKAVCLRRAHLRHVSGMARQWWAGGSVGWRLG
eukprot:TRINITY_DN35961_c0_g1_i1.p1 TRINITY_DN35961_c0_g1~~TRINITY_DN35961_c0_g1_i1.p1  ORF type:complete len:200 (+),score=49.80 TRINITY_DN35961_c0_g1_i1:89-688(+)